MHATVKNFQCFIQITFCRNLIRLKSDAIIISFSATIKYLLFMLQHYSHSTNATIVSFNNNPKKEEKLPILSVILLFGLLLSTAYIIIHDFQRQECNRKNCTDRNIILKCYGVANIAITFSMSDKWIFLEVIRQGSTSFLSDWPVCWYPLWWMQHDSINLMHKMQYSKDACQMHAALTRNFSLQQHWST